MSGYLDEVYRAFELIWMVTVGLSSRATRPIEQCTSGIGTVIHFIDDLPERYLLDGRLLSIAL